MAIVFNPQPQTTTQLTAPLTVDLSAVQAEFDSLSAELAQLKEQTPSNEDLLVNWSNGGAPGENLADGTYAMFSAPMDMTILAASFVFSDAANFHEVVADDANYYKFQLVNVCKTPSKNLVIRTTQEHGDDANGGIYRDRDWNADGATWITRDLRKGDVLTLRVSTIGTPSEPLPAILSVTCRYRRGI